MTHIPDARIEHVAVIHAGDGQALIVPLSNLPELKARLHLAFAYSETHGQATYDHYDCWGVSKHCRA